MRFILFLTRAICTVVATGLVLADRTALMFADVAAPVRAPREVVAVDAADLEALRRVVTTI